MPTTIVEDKMGKITVNQKGKRRIEGGHPWVFSSDIIEAGKAIDPGDVVDVLSAENRFMGRGYYNPKSQISLRMLTRQDEPIDSALIARRVQQAADYRTKLGLGQAYRLINAESDFLPAVIVDKFGSVLVMQTLSLGMEKLKGHMTDALMALPGIKGIYERNDVSVRTLEGLEQNKGILCGQFETQVVIDENGVKLVVDIENGQKTGYFLDQRENRAAIAPFVRGGRVLDCFCHIGSFALHAARYGAADVTGVDVSEEAVNRATVLARLNGYDSRCHYVAANAFDHLRALQAQKELYDAIILDPPAFAKSKDAVKNAERGYKDINFRAMKLLKPGGFLITCSCSHHMPLDLFQEMLGSAALDAGRDLRIIEVRGQAKDHPHLLAAPETNYLKCIIAQVR
jgi:23S rRNA (cytosine1962-C5)-methyltransferase